jgi:hypothetical protein
MRALMAAIVFAATAAGGPGGNLFVRVSPGFEILVDGTSTAFLPLMRAGSS